MANITTFATLKSEILAMIGRAPADPVYQLVTKEINEDLRLKVMENTAALLEAATVNFVATVTGATQANPCVITAVDHGFATGAQVTFADVVGMTELNGNTYTITKVDADSFSLDDTNSSAYTAYTSGGTATLSPAPLSIVSVERDADPITVLTPTTPQAIYQRKETAGDPTRFAFVKDTLILDRPGSGKTLNIRYYGELDLFSADGDTNAVLTTYPQIYLYGALFHHANMIRDKDDAAHWGALYEAAKRRAEIKDRDDVFSPGPLISVPMSGTP